MLGPNNDEGNPANAAGGDEDWRVELRLRNGDAEDQQGAPPNAPAEQDLEANVDGAADADELRALARDDAQVVVQVDGVIEINGIQVDGGVDDAARPPAPGDCRSRASQPSWRPSSEERRPKPHAPHRRRTRATRTRATPGRGAHHPYRCVGDGISALAPGFALRKECP